MFGPKIVLFGYAVVLGIMARMPICKKKRIATIMVLCMNLMNNLLLMMLYICIALILDTNGNRRVNTGAALSHSRNFIRSIYVGRIIFDSDFACYDKVRMDRKAFYTLCEMLKTTGRLCDNKNSSVEEMVAMFLFMLAHHVKHRIIKADFVRSGETVSRQFNVVLNAVLRLHKHLLKKPEPVSENSTDDRWKWFKVHFKCKCIYVLAS